MEWEKILDEKLKNNHIGIAYKFNNKIYYHQTKVISDDNKKLTLKQLEIWISKSIKDIVLSIMHNY